MDFGIKPAQGGQTFAETKKQAVTAEEYGFSSVFLSEHHGYETYWPSPLVALGGVSAVTSSIRLGTAVKLLPLMNPVELAGRIAVLDVVSEGRVGLGFGLGWDPNEFEAYGIPKRERGARMTEYLVLMNELFAPGPTSFDGEFYQFEEFELFPKAVQTPRPTFFVGGTSDQAYMRAREFADGWIAPGGQLAEIAGYADEYRESGGDGRVIVTNQATVVRESSEEAVSAMKRFIRQFHELLAARGHPYSTSMEELNDELEHSYDEYIADRCLVSGSPDECIQKIQRIHDMTDFDEFILRVSTFGLPEEEGMRTLEVLGTEVLPSF